MLQQVAIQAAQPHKVHAFLSKLLQHGPAGIEMNIRRCLPALLLLSAELFIREKRTLWAMGTLAAMQRMKIAPEKRTLTLFLALVQNDMADDTVTSAFKSTLLSFSKHLAAFAEPRLPKTPTSDDARMRRLGVPVKPAGSDTPIQCSIQRLQRTLAREHLQRRPLEPRVYSTYNKTGNSLTGGRSWDDIGKARMA